MAPAMNFAARQGNFACGLARTSSPTISHLSFANLWNHLPNDILDEWTRRKLRCLRLKQCKHPKGIRRFLESIGCKRKLWSGIAAMGRRWWRIACSEPANICMDNAWLRAEGYISFYQLLKR